MWQTKDKTLGVLAGLHPIISQVTYVPKIPKMHPWKNLIQTRPKNPSQRTSDGWETPKDMELLITINHLYNPILLD